jgi:hypothetical protein
MAIIPPRFPAARSAAALALGDALARALHHSAAARRDNVGGAACFIRTRHARGRDAAGENACTKTRATAETARAFLAGT